MYVFLKYSITVRLEIVASPNLKDEEREKEKPQNSELYYSEIFVDFNVLSAIHRERGEGSRRRVLGF